MPLPSNTASLSTLLAAAESVESRVLGWLHSLPDSPADLSIADLNSAAQALWRLTAVRKTLSLIAGCAPPTRPRGAHVMPEDADPNLYPFETQEEKNAHIAWCREMTLASGPGFANWSPAKNVADIDLVDEELDVDLGPPPAATVPPSTPQTPDAPEPQADPSAHSSPSPEHPQSSPAAPLPNPLPRALSIPSCPAIPGKLPNIPSAAPTRPETESPRDARGAGVSPVFPPAPTPSILDDCQRPEGPAANSPARQGGVTQEIPVEARRAATPNVNDLRDAERPKASIPPTPSVPFPKAPLEFGVVTRPSRPP